jgi:hypothetical protein
MKTINYLLLVLAILLSQTAFAQSLEEKNFQIAASYFTEVLNKRNIDMIDELFDKDFKLINYDTQREWSGAERLKEVVRTYFKGHYYEILDHIGNGEDLFILVKRTVPWPEYVSSDSKETYTQLVFERFIIRNEKIVEFRRGNVAQINEMKELSGFEGGFSDIVKALSTK